MTIINNSNIASWIKDSYSIEDIEKLWQLLEQKGTLKFSPLDNGLFPAAKTESSTDYTGYQAVWVRDNIHVAHALYLWGTPTEKRTAVRTMLCLADFLVEELDAFKNTVNAGRAPQNQMLRPHIRFDGKTLEKIDQEWNHAQNDALGYFLWFFCKLIEDKSLKPSSQDGKLLNLLVFYFEAIEYWQDADSGHWEETAKIAASSIGVVIAALKTMRKLLIADRNFANTVGIYRGKTVTPELLNNLIANGEAALSKILPWESVQPHRERRYDAALLFLIYPLQVVSDQQASEILTDVVANLQGAYGISRYQNDSFWCRDYQDIPENIRTSIATERDAWLKARDRELNQGEEAQWCIFDPIISVIYGLQYQKSPRSNLLAKQTEYLNRSLRQITSKDFYLGGFKCPELYYLQNGKYIPGDATPLLWTQANLLLALKWMQNSLVG
ncbi:glycosyl hydrolase, glucoamylase [Xenococcus sp. PCC 7305]|uniref:glycoside hydrolase family 15 protein n=1 Tax=Xenococcus sp. PCC 7305 TaxID=102125 RepID=UPI0002ABDFE6|nr:glycoside hydrolase family 15 protein [Xenococcus sp. PCC 7305]ELS04070.1 glycosyl hydrolase, glucoamylase [Xenococcus sp. PCC 7305]